LSENTLGRRASLADGTVFAILTAISFSHFLNDTIQSLLPAIYPLLKTSFRLSFVQIGLITLTFQLTASILQPVVGYYTDRHPRPYSLAVGMGSSLFGLLLLAVANHFYLLLLAAALIGTGSSIFHPESSRVARLASGGRHGFAQSFFQVGGNIGSSIGPLLAAFIVVPYGQRSIAIFSLIALLAIFVLWNVGRWYREHLGSRRAKAASVHAEQLALLSRSRVTASVVILLTLIFSKYFYLASLTSYFTFYLISKFGLSVQSAQIHLFIFLGAVAVGTFVGGPVGDYFGRKYVIWFSILGVLPFTLMLPYASLFWTGVLTVVIGLILASAFAAILVYATELMPGKVGTVAGLFFGFAFGMGGLGAAALGALADMTSIGFVYKVCAFLPAIGLLAALLPNLDGARRRKAKASV
jgi:FSR family fosmidomycin resistance protein-like MFS transporter